MEEEMEVEVEVVVVTRESKRRLSLLVNQSQGGGAEQAIYCYFMQTFHKGQDREDVR
jgi:hypothetical protein